MTDVQATDQARKVLRNRIIGAVLVLLAIVVAFLIFIDQTYRVVINQNKQYSETTTSQMARRLDELFTDSQTCLNMASITFENTLTSPNVTASNIHNLATDTMFEYVLYASRDGRVLNEAGEVSDVKERDYIQEGFKGKSGVSVRLESEFFNGANTLIFYEPLRYNNEIIGVLAGVFTEQALSEEVSMSIFGHDASSFLCERDGSIIATSDDRFNDAISVFDLNTNLIPGFKSNDPNFEKLDEVFKEGGSDLFTYSAPDGVGCAYATKLAHFDFMLLSAFPLAVTNAMASQSNGLGMTLMAVVAGILVIYIIVLILQGRRQRNELRKANKHITSVVDASTNLFRRFAVFDLQDLTYRYYKAEGVNGAIPLEGPYHVFADYWISTIEDPQEREAMEEALNVSNMQANLKEDIPFLRYEFRSSTDEGRAWLQVSIICMERDASGKPIKALYSVQDVTEVKKKEERTREALEDAYRAAEHASQAKSNFLSSMSHDIRTPMNSIMGLTALASMNIGDPVRVRDCLTKINTANRHLLGLINEVLDMAKIESGNISLSEEAFNLSDVVDEVLLIVRPQVEAKHQDLRVNISNIHHEHVLGDPMRLKQVFLNILGNAVKFTPDGGTVTFDIDEMPSNLQGCGCYKFTISDTGCGISESFMEHLFEPFAREEDLRISKIEGTGLGLPIVKSIVELMSGSIDVDSEIDKGTTFTIVVYIKTTDDNSDDVKPLKGLDVLVCDDDEASCQGACAMLNAIGMNAEYATSGEEALDLVRSREAEGRGYTAIITDWKMPGADGMEVAREIRENASPEMPIVLVSAYDWSEIEESARNLGVSVFVSKPLFKSRLVHAMHKAVIGEVSEPAETDALSSCDLTGKRILLTDDNELAAEVAMDLLSITNAEIDRAVNGKDAYDKLLDHEPGYYDIVLMDVQMPVMNGHEASRAIRDAAASKSRPDLSELPIIALTADAFSDDVEKAKAAGMNAHMSKPIDLEALVRILTEWID